MATFQLRWGIVSAGKISNDFVVALATLNPAEHTVVAVAARSADRAKEFAAKHPMIQKFYGSYEEMANDKNIDVVYIGAINTEHKSIAKAMLDSGKHVLCEKPMCLSEEDTRELCLYARQKKLFLMEAIWSRFFPAYRRLQEIISEKKIGEIYQINCNFGVPIANVDRVKKPELGGGTIHDLGIYVLQFQQLFFGKGHTEIIATGTLNEHGVDESAYVIIKYPERKVAILSTNANVVGSNVAEIMGNKGFVQVPNFWCPDTIISSDGPQKFDLPPTESFLNFTNSTGLSYEATETRRCIMNGLLESPDVSHDDSIHLAYLRDEILRQIKK